MNLSNTRIWPLRIAFAAACAGTVILLAWFSAYWPGRHWTVIPRSQLLAKALQVNRHFGLNTTDWKVSTVTQVSNVPTADLHQHSGDLGSRSVSPLSLQITFKAKNDGQTAVVAIDSAGLPVS